MITIKKKGLLLYDASGRWTNNEKEALKVKVKEWKIVISDTAIRVQCSAECRGDSKKGLVSPSPRTS